MGRRNGMGGNVMNGKRMRRLRSAGFALSLLLLPPALAGSAAAQPAKAGGPPLKIRMGVQITVLGAVAAANELDLFRQVGLEMQFIKFTSGPAQFDALKGGGIDLGWGALVAFLGAYANGLPAQWVLTLIDHNRNEALFVSKGSPAQKLEDLKGKKIGATVGSDAYFALVKALQQKNIAPGEVQILNMPPPQMVAALLNQNIDAGFSWNPFITQVVERGGRVLVTADKVGGFSYLGVVANSDWLKNNGEAMTRFVRALEMASVELQKNPDLAATATARMIGMTVEQARIINRGNRYYPLSAVIDPKSPVATVKGGAVRAIIEEAADLQVRLGTAKTRADIDGFVNTEIIERYLRRGASTR